MSKNKLHLHEGDCYRGDGRLMFKRQPIYCQALDHYPAINPIFVTVEFCVLKIIQRFHGLCLFCPPPLQNLDLSCCFQREVWVLYSQSIYLSRTIELAQVMQQSGAAEITIIRLGG